MVDLVLQYLYKLDYNDSPSVTEPARDSHIWNLNGIQPREQSRTSLAPTSVLTDEQSGFADQNFESADNNIPNPEDEDSMEVSVSPFEFALLTLFPGSSLSLFLYHVCYLFPSHLHGSQNRDAD